MIRRSKGHAVVEVMNIDREIRASFSKLVDAMAFHNEDKIDIEKARMQFKKISDREMNNILRGKYGSYSRCFWKIHS